MINSVYRLWLIASNHRMAGASLCAKCGGQVVFDNNTYKCQKCFDHGGMLEYCLNQMNAGSIEEAYKLLEAEYEPRSYFTALEQARRLFPNIENVYGEEKLMLEVPQGFIAPPNGCSKCGGTNFIYVLRPSGTATGRCLRCGSPYPHLPKEGSKHKNLDRGNQNQQANWRRDVRKRYGGKCALCGSEDNVEAHHILPVSVDPEYSLSLNNGILLCKKHHDMIHTNPVYVHNGGSPWSTK